MRWEGGRRSENVEDRRGGGGPVGPPGGLGGGFGRRAGGLGIGGVAVLLLLSLVFGIDPRVILEGDGGAYDAPPQQQAAAPEQDRLADFVSVVLANTEDVWRGAFASIGRQYEEPRLVLFSGAVSSACGRASAAMGPFYCPADRQIYIDLAFYRDLRDRLGAPGDFAQAYVIAHEVGHHVQNLLGVAGEVERQRRGLPEPASNALSVKLELQADCFAGVWARQADTRFRMVEEGDLDEALGAAAAVGDDRLQRQAQGRVVPDSFTHGTSAQRASWFRRGYGDGDLRVCDTFGG